MAFWLGWPENVVVKVPLCEAIEKPLNDALAC
jgi:hypothetical protein